MVIEYRYEYLAELHKSLVLLKVIESILAEIFNYLLIIRVWIGLDYSGVIITLFRLSEYVSINTHLH